MQLDKSLVGAHSSEDNSQEANKIIWRLKGLSHDIYLAFFDMHGHFYA